MERIIKAAHRISSHRRVLRARRAAGRGLEILRYAFVRPSIDQNFHIVSAQRNMGEAAIRCLDSVYAQRYHRERVSHVFIDDASDDATPALIEQWLRNHPDHTVQYIRNTERRGMLANNLAGFDLAGPADIGVELNGDDWLPDAGVLRFFNRVYSSSDVWMTYNTCQYLDGSIAFPLAPPRRVVADGSHRDSPWATTALHTFRMGLYRRLERESLVDPDTGAPWEYSQDQAVYLPLLEMSGRHARHIYRTTYIYNFHGQSDEQRNRPAQLDATRRIRSLPPYAALESIDL